MSLARLQRTVWVYANVRIFANFGLIWASPIRFPQWKISPKYRSVGRRLGSFGFLVTQCKITKESVRLSLWSICERPDLGEFVRQLTVCPYAWPPLQTTLLTYFGWNLQSFCLWKWRVFSCQISKSKVFVRYIQRKFGTS